MWRGGARMQPPLKQLGLTQLEKVLPTLFETARQEQWTYELFLTRALGAEIEGRDRRAAERRMTAARLPTLKTLEAFDFTFQPSLSERLLGIRRCLPRSPIWLRPWIPLPILAWCVSGSVATPPLVFSSLMRWDTRA